jgi:hypothetical protein
VHPAGLLGGVGRQKHPAGRVQNRRVQRRILRPKAYWEELICRTCDASCPGFPYIMFLGL